MAPSMSAMAVGYRRWREPQLSLLGRSVDRQGRVDVPDPGHHAALDVDGLAEPGRLDRGERLGRPYPRLAVQDDLPVLREAGQCLAGQDLPLGYQAGAGDAHDLVLGRLTHVDQLDRLTRVDPVLQLPGGDRRA